MERRDGEKKQEKKKQKLKEEQGRRSQSTCKIANYVFYFMSMCQKIMSQQILAHQDILTWEKIYPMNCEHKKLLMLFTNKLPQKTDISGV